MKEILLLLVLLPLISAIQLLLLIFPLKIKSRKTPKDFGLDYEKVEFSTRDGLKLRGWLIKNPKSDKIILMCHGYPFDKGSLLQIAKFLATHYNVLLFDFRYFGESEGKYTTGGLKEVKDVLAALEFLKNKGFEKIGCMGFSMGASALVMSESKDIKAMALDSPYADILKGIESGYLPLPKFMRRFFAFLTFQFGKIFFKNLTKKSPLESMEKIKCSVLFIHNKKDFLIPKENSEILCKKAKNSEIFIFDSFGHCDAFFKYREMYCKIVAEFFKKNL